MNANELADKLNAISGHKDNDWNQFIAINKAAQMLRQQADRIAELEHMNKNWQLSETMAYNRIAELEKENSELKYEKSSKVYEDEPVAWLSEYGDLTRRKDLAEYWEKINWPFTPLYTTPQYRELSDEDILKLAKSLSIKEAWITTDQTIEFANAVLKKASEK